MSKNYPLLYAVYEVLRKKSPITDRELIDEVTSIYPGASLSQVEEALLKLEVLGKIVVTHTGKKRDLRIELAEGRAFLSPDEE